MIMMTEIINNNEYEYEYYYYYGTGPLGQTVTAFPMSLKCSFRHYAGDMKMNECMNVRG